MRGLVLGAAAALAMSTGCKEQGSGSFEMNIPNKVEQKAPDNGIDSMPEVEALLAKYRAESQSGDMAALMLGSAAVVGDLSKCETTPSDYNNGIVLTGEMPVPGLEAVGVKGLRVCGDNLLSNIKHIGEVPNMEGSQIPYNTLVDTRNEVKADYDSFIDEAKL
ncbi:MAG: hypothetical protein AAB373_03525 [Patescibacteria group bacterium]